MLREILDTVQDLHERVAALESTPYLGVHGRAAAIPVRPISIDVIVQATLNAYVGCDVKRIWRGADSGIEFTIEKELSIGDRLVYAFQVVLERDGVVIHEKKDWEVSLSPNETVSIECPYPKKRRVIFYGHWNPQKHTTFIDGLIKSGEKTLDPTVLRSIWNFMVDNGQQVDETGFTDFNSAKIYFKGPVTSHPGLTWNLIVDGGQFRDKDDVYIRLEFSGVEDGSQINVTGVDMNSFPKAWAIPEWLHKAFFVRLEPSIKKEHSLQVIRDAQ